jgi:hypothetical protein
MTNVYEFQEKVFDYISVITYILYIVIAFGLSSSELAPKYLDDLLFYTKMYISLFLIYRFNPFTLSKFTPLDAKIAYNAGIFLLFTTALNSVLVKYIYFFKMTQKSIIDKIKANVMSFF